MASRLRKRRTVESVKRGEQTIETLLVVDQKMVQYHGLDAAKQYALTLASIVSIPVNFIDYESFLINA